MQIGGELAYKNEKLHTYFTDSGRSSLRVFLENFPQKKILIPDYLCQTIVIILDQEKIAYEYYHVQENLHIDIDTVNNKTFDVLYVINYFGLRHNNLKHIDFSDKVLLEDNVFKLTFSNIYKATNWYGFNSYRKVSIAAEGSQSQTNMDITIDCVPYEAPFSNMKYQAKSKKFDYLNLKFGIEEEYLSLFNKAESLLDEQRNIFIMSNLTHKIIIDMCLNYNKDQNQRKKRYDLLSNILQGLDIELNFERDEYSFFILKLSNRDELRKHLSDNNIFLPIHWPAYKVNNILYDEVLSIPLFSQYTLNDIEKIGKEIRYFLNE